MNSAATATATASSPWARLHGALMPDYNRKATVYWWTMVAIGLVTLLFCAAQVAQMPHGALLQILVGTAVATFAGFFPVRIPRSKNSFAAGEIFIFLVLLLHGPAAASLAAAGEALVGSWRTSKRWTSRIASPAMAVVSMFLAGSLLQLGVDMLRARGWYNDGLLMTAAMVFSLAYFVLNTLLATLVIHLKRNQPMVLREVLSNFGWVAMAYAGSASVAGLLFLTVGQSGPGVLMAVVPIVGMLLTTLHFFFRQQEAAEHQRGGVLVTLMAVMVILVRRLLAVMHGKQHHEVGHQVGQGMHAVGDQPLGAGQHAGGHLGERQRDIDDHADPGAAFGGGLPFRGGVFTVQFGQISQVIHFDFPRWTRVLIPSYWGSRKPG